MKLTTRQQQCLIALLDIEEEAMEAGVYWRRVHTNAGAIAWRLGFRLGPYQHGNGAKSGRSFSGYGAAGKWVTFSLVGLERKGLVRREWNLLDLDDRMKHHRLTPDGRWEAKRLRDQGVVAYEYREREART